jgi:hypothetical protein
MCAVRKWKTVAAVATAMAMGGLSSTAYATESTGCQTLGHGVAYHYNNGTGGSTLAFNAGEVITLTVGTIAPPVTMTSPVNAALTTNGQAVSYTVAVTGNVTILLVGAGSSDGTISCAVGSTSSGGSSSQQQVSQTINNASAAVSNGTQVLQNYSGWISNGVQGSFDLLGGNGGGSTAEVPEQRLQPAGQQAAMQLQAKPQQPARPTERLQALTAARKVKALQEQQAELLDEQQGRPLDEDTQRKLAEVKQALLIARVGVNIAPPAERLQIAGTTPAEQRVYDGPTGGATVPSSAPPALSIHSSDIAEMCQGDDELAQASPYDPVTALGKKWNVWLEGRAIGAWDNLAQSQSFGLVGAVGMDYKINPWLAVGMSVGVESFYTKFGSFGATLGSTGVTAMPYVGFHLADHIYASAFVGLTQISYAGTPTAGDSSNFTALRVMVGGSLFGNWQFGPWRVKPTLAATYGSESQNGYTDSLGNIVAGQTVTYGRIGAGPEVGYSFSDPNGAWVMEPFVLANANIDFASSNSTILQGQSVVLRPGTLGSGQVGAGLNARFANGYYFRIQGSYDSIGVSGLDVFSGMIRGGMTF